LLTEWDLHGTIDFGLVGEIDLEQGEIGLLKELEQGDKQGVQIGLEQGGEMDLWQGLGGRGLEYRGETGLEQGQGERGLECRGETALE
jgi:hypothetical protein